MLHLIVAYAFLIQSYLAADVTWIGTEPLSISLGDYSFFGLTGDPIYEFDGSSVITLNVSEAIDVKFQSEAFISCGNKMCPAVILLGEEKGVSLKLVNSTLERVPQEQFAPVFDTNWPETGFNSIKKILTYPRKVREEFDHYNFLSILTSGNDIDHSVYTAKIIEDDVVSMQGLMNYAVNTTFSSTTYIDAGLSMVRAAVCVHYSTNSTNGSNTILFNSSFPEPGDAISEITLTGVTDLKIQLSEASTGGMFLWNDNGLFYSSFEGYLPMQLKFAGSNFPPTDETIHSFTSGDLGDFMVITDTENSAPNNRKIYYGKEGYFRIYIEEIPSFGSTNTDSTNFVLQSMSKIIKLPSDEDSFNAASDIYELSTLTTAQSASKPCVIQKNSLENSTLILDSKESVKPVATLRGTSPVAVVVTTSVPNEMVLSYETDDSRDQNEIYTKKISTMVHPKETSRDEPGTRIVPFVSWYITDTVMSCVEPSFSVSLLHYGTCPTATRLIEPDDNVAAGKWVYEGLHSTTHFFLSNVFQFHLDENGKLTKSSETKTYLESQVGFTNSEHERGSGKCTKVNCPFQRYYYMPSFMIEANVGKPFFPEFKIVDENKEEYDFGYKEHTLVVLGEITGGSGFMGTNEERKTFNLVKNTMELMNSESRSYAPLAKGILEMNDINSNSSVYQYTFNGEMAGCTGAHQSYIGQLDKILLGLGKSRDSVFSKDDFDFQDVWNRQNFVSCRENSNSTNPDKTFSELNSRLKVPIETLVENRESINKRLRDSVIEGLLDENGEYEESVLDNLLQIPENTANFSGYAPLLCSSEGITDAGCTNQFIFTKPGRYVMSAILLDPNASGCDLRVSFIVKVNGLPDISLSANNQMFLSTAIITLLVFLWYFVEPCFSRQKDKLQDRVSQKISISFDQDY